jgi:hypothetical protein
LLFADRTPKFPLERLRRATTGGAPLEDAESKLGSHPHPPLAVETPVTLALDETE